LEPTEEALRLVAAVTDSDLSSIQSAILIDVAQRHQPAKKASAEAGGLADA
jgi:hypothetical protein